MACLVVHVAQGVEGGVVAKVVELSDGTFGGGCLAGAVEEVCR